MVNAASKLRVRCVTLQCNAVTVQHAVYHRPIQGSTHDGGSSSAPAGQCCAADDGAKPLAHRPAVAHRPSAVCRCSVSAPTLVRTLQPSKTSDQCTLLSRIAMTGHHTEQSHGGKSDAAAAAAHPAQPTAAAHDHHEHAANGDLAASAADEPRKHPTRKAAVAAAEAITAAVAGVSHDASAAVAAAAPAAGTRKRRLSIDSGSTKAASKSTAKAEHSDEHAAASRIQALVSRRTRTRTAAPCRLCTTSHSASCAAPAHCCFCSSCACFLQVRGARARTQHKQDVLWNAWNLLDWREESALMSSHGAYEALKKAVQDRKTADEAEEKKASGSDTKAKRKRAASPSPRSKKSRPSVSDAEAEAALGLGLNDRDPLTFAWVEQMMDCFKRNQQLPSSLVLKLLARVTPLLAALPNIVPVSVPARVTVVGDLHGQLDDLLAIFKLQGLPSSRNRFCFNGDFVDRGQHSVECILTLLAWKVLLPNDVFLNRGNHEARDINGRDGFEKECLQKYPGKTGTKIFDAFSACFAALPIVHIIEQQVTQQATITPDLCSPTAPPPQSLTACLLSVATPPLRSHPYCHRCS